MHFGTVIDNYMPLSDWRDGDHLDQDFNSIYNLDYLRANIAGGEGFDWYYASPEGEAAQLRQPIIDTDWGEDWIYRYKDLRGWWQNFHYSRIGGTRAATPWVPASKPFRFTEYGVAAVDKGTNQPNRFLDPKSSESGLPKYSNGRRDDLMQMAYFRAMYLHWTDPAQNPQSAIYNGAMLDFHHSHAWAWDARPFPDFPRNTALWSDGANYAGGHWLNGRISNQPLSAVLAEICAEAGVTAPDLSQCYAMVRGYTVQDTTTARAMMQPLLLAHAQEVVEKGGRLHIQGRDLGAITPLDQGALVRSAELDGALETTRAAVLEETSRLRLGYIEAEGSYGARIAEAIFPDHGRLAQSELPLVLHAAEAGEIAQRWMAEARISRVTTRFALPKSRLDLGAGDRVQIGDQVYRIDSTLQGEYQLIEAVRSETALYRPALIADIPRPWTAPIADVPVTVRFLDLPLLTGDEVAHAPYVCAVAKPWPGKIAVWSAVTDDNYALSTVLNSSATFGITETALAAAPSGLWQRTAPLRVKLATGSLSSASQLEVLAGANLAAIGSADQWEVIQFTDAVLVAPDTYDIRQILRGQAGSLSPDLWPIGSEFILINAALQQINLPLSARGLTRNYRVGRAASGYQSPSVVHEARSFSGLGLRPYSVAHLRATPSGNDIAVSWIRRTRTDGDTWDSLEVPLSETSEAYTVRVMSGANILREVVTSSPSFTYTAGDGAGISVAQRSDGFGNGPFRTILV